MDTLRDTAHAAPLSRLGTSGRGRRAGRLALPIVASLALAGLASSASAQQSFPLVCHGGSGMVATLEAGGDLRITFTPTSVGTGAVAPGGGECGFLDRGFRPGEPSLLLFRGDRNGIHVLIEAMLNDAPFILNVFNDNEGSMVVTGIGP